MGRKRDEVRFYPGSSRSISSRLDVSISGGG